MSKERIGAYPVNLKAQPRSYGHEADTPNSGFVNLPVDMPAHLKVVRLVKETSTHMELVGWTAVVDTISFGVKVFVRIGRDGTLKLFVEDADGTRKVEEWDIND